MLFSDCIAYCIFGFFFVQAEDGIRDLVRSRGLGDVYKRQHLTVEQAPPAFECVCIPNLRPGDELRLRQQ